MQLGFHSARVDENMLNFRQAKHFDISVKLQYDKHPICSAKKKINHETGYALHIFFGHKKPPGRVIEKTKCYLCI